MSNQQRIFTVAILLTVVLATGRLNGQTLDIPNASVNELAELWETSDLVDAYLELKTPVMVEINAQERFELKEFHVKNGNAWFEGLWQQGESMRFGRVYVIQQNELKEMMSITGITELEEKIPALKDELDLLRKQGVLDDSSLSGIVHKFVCFTKLENGKSALSQWHISIDTGGRAGVKGYERFNFLYGMISTHLIQ